MPTSSGNHGARGHKNNNPGATNVGGNPVDGPPSAPTIKSCFEASAGLLTIGLRKTVIGKQPEIAQQRFAKLMKGLHYVDEQNTPAPPTVRILLWIVDFRSSSPSASSNENVEQLQNSLRAVSGSDADWLQERSMFLLNNDSKQTIEDYASRHNMAGDAYRSASAYTDLTLFEGFEQGIWTKFDALTAFPQMSSTSGSVIRYFGHGAPVDGDWKEGPHSEEVEAESADRDSFILETFSAASQSLFGNDSNEKGLGFVALFKFGFLAYRLDDFLRIT